MSTSAGRFGVAVVLVLVGTAVVAAQQPSTRAVLTIPAAGTFARGGEFKGTISVNRFARRGNEIVAIGFVSGILSRGSRALGTAITGEVAWPVQVTAGGLAVARAGAPEHLRLRRVVWTPPVAPAGAFLRVQAESCPVLNVAVGPNTVDLMGLEVALSGATLDLSGAPGTPVGDLVCAASDLLGNVAGLVNLLNTLLGVVTGLLGGLTGGLGAGAIPVP